MRQVPELSLSWQGLSSVWNGDVAPRRRDGDGEVSGVLCVFLMDVERTELRNTIPSFIPLTLGGRSGKSSPADGICGHGAKAEKTG